jgi:hypothetical protein
MVLLACVARVGPSFPWGFMDAHEDSMGMDSQWHSGLEDAAIVAGLLPAPTGYEVPGPRPSGSVGQPANAPDRAGGIVSVGRARLGAGPAGDRPYVMQRKQPSLYFEGDNAAKVVEYLERRKCAVCRASLGAVPEADIVRARFSPIFRCLPPIPTCWELACPSCKQRIIICVRKGKAWPLGVSSVTRRSPGPRKRSRGPAAA